MPIYEYVCAQCGERQSFLVRRPTQSFTPRCRSCGGEELKRLVSRFAFHRAWESRAAEATPVSGYSDPRQIGRRTERRFREMGQEVPHEVREMIDRTRDGELPEHLNDL